MKDLYDSSGFQWCDLDKKDELFEHGGAARFLVARHRTGEKKPVGFVHFRFTLQGEAVGVIGGEPCLYVMDAQLEPAVQRKGLGTHMFSMLDTIARKQGMNHLMLPFVKGDEGTKAFCLDGLAGFAVDDLSSVATAQDGEFDAADILAEDGTFSILSRKPDAALGAAGTPAKPTDGERSAADTPEKEAGAAPVAALAFDPTFGAADAGKDAKEDARDAAAAELIKALEDAGGLPVGLDQAAKSMLVSLLEMFKEQTGREPTREDIQGWVAKIQEHAGEENGDEEDGEEGSEDESEDEDEDDE